MCPWGVDKEGDMVGKEVEGVKERCRDSGGNSKGEEGNEKEIA